MTANQIIGFKGVYNFLSNLFDGDLHAKRVLSLANATLGVIQTASLAVNTIGQGLALARGLTTNAGLTPQGSADVLHGGSRNRLAGQVTRKQPVPWSNRAIVVPKDIQQPGRQHDVAIFSPFALLHADGHALAVDRRGRQADCL